MDTQRELPLALRAAYLALHRRTDARFAEHHVTADQFVLLASLSDGEALTQRELADRISSDPEYRSGDVGSARRKRIRQTRQPPHGRPGENCIADCRRQANAWLRKAASPSSYCANAGLKMRRFLLEIENRVSIR